MKAFLCLLLVLLGCFYASAQQEQLDLPRMRVVHAARDFPEVTVRVDDEELISNLAFKQVSDYIEVEAGPHNIEIVESENQENVLLTQEIEFSDRQALTLALTAEAEAEAEPEPEPEQPEEQTRQQAEQNLILTQFQDDLFTQLDCEGEVLVKAYHLVTVMPEVEAEPEPEPEPEPDQPTRQEGEAEAQDAISIILERTDDEQQFFFLSPTLTFGEATEYHAMPTGSYNVQVRSGDLTQLIGEEEAEGEQPIIVNQDQVDQLNLLILQSSQLLQNSGQIVSIFVMDDTEAEAEPEPEPEPEPDQPTRQEAEGEAEGEAVGQIAIVENETRSLFCEEQQLGEQPGQQ